MLIINILIIDNCHLFRTYNDLYYFYFLITLMIVFPILTK